MKKIKIVSTHIENDVANDEPKIIFSDENGIEWVQSHKPLDNTGAGVSVLIRKSECWYFQQPQK